MLNRQLLKTLPILAAVFGVLMLTGVFKQQSATAAVQDQLPAVFRSMPEGWAVEKSINVTGQQLDVISKKLGGRLTFLSNTFVSFAGQQVQINTFTVANETDADALESKLRKMKSSPRLVQRNGPTLYEFVARNRNQMRLASAARYALGIQPKVVRYRVKFEAAPIKTCDYMKWNGLFNLFLQAEANPSPKMEQRIAAATTDFEFSNRLSLLHYGVGKTPTQQTVSPRPTETQGTSGGELREFEFKKMTEQFGINTVSVELEVTSTSGQASPIERNDELVSATDRWPVNDPRILKLAESITKSATTPEEKVKAILEWLSPGTNMRYAGDVTGSRYGVKKFLTQKFGHCWDFSDAFVTLCRASGVSSRQVFGWLHNSEGHVWAEVLIPGVGWKHVDPTATSGCGSDYIPITASETGEISFVYASKVQIEVLD